MPLLPVIISFFIFMLMRCITSSDEKSCFVFVAGPSFCRWAGLDLNLAKHVTVVCGEADVVVPPFGGIKNVIDDLRDISLGFIKISAYQLDVHRSGKRLQLFCNISYRLLFGWIISDCV